MSQKSYNYLDRFNILIDASEDLLRRLGKSIEEKPSTENLRHDCLLRVENGLYQEIVKDKRFPYLSVRKSVVPHHTSYDFFRYNTPSYSILEINKGHFIIIDYSSLNEQPIFNCIGSSFFNNPVSSGKVLTHASLVDVNGEGILIAGPLRSGKTTLTVNFLELLGAKFISEGRTILSLDNGKLIGEYLPRPVYLRFSTILQSPKIKDILDHHSDLEATQSFDIDAIERIIKMRAFDVDAGLWMSREKFKGLLEMSSASRAVIKRIILPKYSGASEAEIRATTPEDCLAALQAREIDSRRPLDIIYGDPFLKPAEITELTLEFLSQVSFLSVSFDGRRDIKKGFMEKLLDG